MRSLLLMGCLCLITTMVLSQPNGRVRSGTPLRWSMNGSVEIMEGDLTQYYGSSDSNVVYTRTSTYESPTLGNPHITRFASVQGLCEQNAMQLSWVALQQASADRYEIEQSVDGRKWTIAGVVPANRSDLGEASYTFSYNKNAAGVFFRINALSTTGERFYSSVIESPCSSNSYRAVTPNPVYSTTTVRIGSPVASKAKLMLVNSNGVIMQVRDASLTAGTNQVTVDMSGFPAGYYNLFIQWRGGRSDNIKLIKQ